MSAHAVRGADFRPRQTHVDGPQTAAPRSPSPHGSMRSDLAGHLASLAEYFNTAIGRSLLRTGVIGPKNWAPTSVRTYFWKARVDAVRIIFERAERRNEIRTGIDHNTALQLATGPLFLRGLYCNDPIDTTQLCTLLAELVWRAVRREDALVQVAIPT